MIAQLEQVEAQLALVDEQLARVEMVAPFDGVIVSGDLSQRLGAPVERGQVLFEVAPLDNFRIALQVDERDIADVRAGQRGELVVSSMPHQRFAFTVTKITAVNTAKDGRNFFRVEARLDARARAPAPGMEGVGKIEIDERRLVWIWTHGLVDWCIRLWLWSVPALSEAALQPLLVPRRDAAAAAARPRAHPPPPLPRRALVRARGPRLAAHAPLQPAGAFRHRPDGRPAQRAGAVGRRGRRASATTRRRRTR